MSSRLRVLIIEDNADDAALIVREVRRGGYDVLDLRVETADAMKKALTTQAWDIVLADYSLPHFTGLEALKLAQAHDPDLPFILISGTLTEDMASAILRSGAGDFIVKGHWARFVPAVERELREAQSRREGRRAEEGLRESEERYRRLVEQSPNAIAVQSEGQLVFVNQAALDLLGAQSPEQLLGKPVLDFMVPDSKEMVRARITKMLSTGQPAELAEEKFVRLDGRVIDVEVTGLPIRFGEKNAVLVIIQDITERKRVKEALKESESWFRSIVESSKDGIIFFDGKTRKIIFGNGAMAALLACSKEDLVGRSIPSLHPSEEWASIEQEFQKHVSSELSFSTGISVLRNDGSVFYADISSSPITLEARSYFSAFFRDITEQKRIERELEAYRKNLEEIVRRRTADLSDARMAALNLMQDAVMQRQTAENGLAESRRMESAVQESKDQLQRILRTTNEGFWVADNLSITREVNEAMCSILGLSRENIIGRSIFDFVDEEGAQILRRQLEIRAVGRATSYEMSLIRPDGKAVPCWLNAVPFTNAQGEQIGSFAMVTDITERKRTEVELRKRAEELDAFNKAMVDREMAVIEKKMEVNRLCRELGREPLYPQVWEEDLG